MTKVEEGESLAGMLAAMNPEPVARIGARRTRRRRRPGLRSPAKELAGRVCSSVRRLVCGHGTVKLDWVELRKGVLVGTIAGRAREHESARQSRDRYARRGAGLRAGWSCVSLTRDAGAINARYHDPRATQRAVGEPRFYYIKATLTNQNQTVDSAARITKLAVRDRRRRTWDARAVMAPPAGQHDHVRVPLGGDRKSYKWGTQPWQPSKGRQSRPR